MSIRLGIAGHLGPPAADVIRNSRRAEADDWDGLWWPDAQLGYFPSDPSIPNPHAIYDSFPMMGAAATCTERLDIGIAVTDPFRRHPALLAQTAQTLQDLSKGRFVLGLGLGAMENLQPFGIGSSGRIAVLEEAVDIIKALWTSSRPISFDGAFWKLNDVVLGIANSEFGQPKIWLAGDGPKTLNLIARKADGWVPVMTPPERYKQKRDQLHAEAQQAGRLDHAISYGCLFLTVAADDDATAERLIDSPWIRGVALSQSSAAFAAFGAQHPLGEGVSGTGVFIPTRHTVDQYKDLVSRIPLRVVKELVLWGSGERIADQLRRYEAAGLEQAILWNVTGSGEATRDEIRGSFRALKRARELLK